NVNSWIEAWRARPRFVKYRLPEPLTRLGPLSGNLWSFVLVPGWRELRGALLEEICARQYVACNEAVLEARRAVAPSRWVDVTYEDLVRAPVEETGRIYECLGLDFTDEARHFAADLRGNLARTTLTEPEPDKWRAQKR